MSLTRLMFPSTGPELEWLNPACTAPTQPLPARFTVRRSVPGPTLHVDQGSEVTVYVRNHGDVEATVRWRGLRLENRFDGVPHETQEAIPVGGTFTYQVQFPHPGSTGTTRIREDFAQEMGLYGTIIVEPADAAYWSPVDRTVALTLDDLLVE